MSEYTPNSNRYKEEQKLKESEKKIEKVATGKVMTKKKSKFSKFAGEIISEDAHSVGSYIVKDVVIPAAKKLIYDIFTDGIDILLYGESRKGNKRSTSDRVSYRNYYDRDTRPTARSYVSSGISYDDVGFTTRGEAEDVLSRMDEIIDTYKIVSVADFFDLAGVRGTPTDNSYGWTSLRNATVVRERDGYRIKFPRAVPID